MASVTVLGANSQVITQTYDSARNAVIAQQLAGAITAGIQDSTLVASSDTTGGPTQLKPGQTGAFTQNLDGLTVLPPGYNAYVDNTTSATVFDSGSGIDTVLAGAGDLSFFGSGGGGTIVGGAGNDRIVLSGSGAWNVALGGGQNLILAGNTGNDTISVGAGSSSGGVGTDRVVLGSGNDLVDTSANQTIVQAGSGNDTISASSPGQVVIFGGSGSLTFIGEGGATVTGGSGSETLIGGSGPDVFRGGQAGDNLLVAGTGTATLYGAGSGDQLWSNGSHGQELVAGAGNETLYGSLSTGSDTMVGGTGSDTMQAGIGKDVFVFMKGNAGVTDIQNFTSQDSINLQGFSAGEAEHALKTAQVANGSTTITLSDNTKITFAGFTDLTKTNFHS